MFEPTHLRIGDDLPVKAVRWVRDGDHPMVERYPVEGRDFKGLMLSGGTKYALRFGDWVLEDEQGRLWVMDALHFNAQYGEV